MRFSLLGDHPDGLNMAHALVATGRHQLASHVGSSKAAESLRHLGLQPGRVGDIEEVLADPAVEAVIVAGSLDNRPGQLRRALQSERHVLCVHPADRTPDAAYEAALIQGDTHHVLLPLLPEALHPGVQRLVDLVRDPAGPLGELRLVEMERWSPGAVLIEAGRADAKPSLPGWDVLRAVGGEIGEVSAYAAAEHATPDDLVLLAGRFERGGLFQMSLIPGRPEPRWRLAVLGTGGEAELAFAGGWPGPAVLRWHDQSGEVREETWDAWDPWPTLVQVFESAAAQATTAKPGSRLTWQDAVRALELDDAARRSIERRRTSALDYQEVSEEVGFKGTMTLVGCGLIWVMLLLWILSRWFRPLAWVILPLLVIFLGLQLLRWVIPANRPPAPEERDNGR
ncbi:MAG TPA: hypothetical protein VG013_42845 [Gemmataceae bacterium]|jgi:predicted dehydrogenase|nr:hypothetical protein [Gemmataceae bacterium]